MKTKIEIFKYKNAPVYFHISLLGAYLYFAYIIDPINGLLATIAFIVLMLAHEIGHAYWVTKFKHGLISIELYILHGLCNFEHDEYIKPERLIHAGGIIMQLLILITWFILLVIVNSLGLTQVDKALEPISYVFIVINVFTILLNLLPLRGLDGHEIWDEFRLSELKFDISEFLPFKKTRKKQQLKKSSKIIALDEVRKIKNKNKTKN